MGHEPSGVPHSVWGELHWEASRKQTWVEPSSPIESPERSRLVILSEEKAPCDCRSMFQYTDCWFTRAPRTDCLQEDRTLKASLCNWLARFLQHAP